MSEREGDNGGKFLSEEARQAEHRRLYDIANRAESKIVFDGETDPRQLDKYLAAEIELHQWIARHPLTKDKSAEVIHHAEKALELTRVYTGSYYTEKSLFCRERADKLKSIAGEKTDEMGIGGRKQAASWLRMEASCLEMPTARPPEQPEQKQ